MPNSATKRNSIAPFLTLLGLIGLILLSKILCDPPPPLPAEAPLKDFSAVRAMGWLKHIADSPHAMGTAPHAQLRKYLTDQLNLLGVETQIQEATVSPHANSGPSKAYVYNVIGLIRGKAHTGSSKSVVLVAHYDSQPNSFGAADDGCGIAVLLETARALKSCAQLKNDVILLMTDGEEYGSFGAIAFLRHPLARQAAVFINMEARGNDGPAFAFEMNSGNGWIVDAFARSAPYPLASSLFYQIYRTLPNNTDFSVFRSANYTGVNSAFIDGFVNYHKLTDTWRNINPASMQQQGSSLASSGMPPGNCRSAIIV